MARILLTSVLFLTTALSQQCDLALRDPPPPTVRCGIEGSFTNNALAARRAIDRGDFPSVTACANNVTKSGDTFNIITYDSRIGTGGRNGRCTTYDVSGGRLGAKKMEGTDLRIYNRECFARAPPVSFFGPNNREFRRYFSGTGTVEDSDETTNPAASGQRLNYLVRRPTNCADAARDCFVRATEKGKAAKFSFDVHYLKEEQLWECLQYSGNPEGDESVFSVGDGNVGNSFGYYDVTG